MTQVKGSVRHYWLLLCVLVLGALTGAPIHAQQPSSQAPLAPLPDPNPKRSGPETTGVPPKPPAPPLPGERVTVPWDDPKVQAARNACTEMLAGLDLDYEQLDPIKKGLCGAPAPILVKSIGKDPAVTISPPATMTCNLAVALHSWFKETVQPSASVLGTSVVKIRNASSYQCRNRYGRADTRISEHALANALDISEFVFASGQRIKLLGNWPYGALQALPLAPEPPAPNPRRDPTLASDRTASSTPDVTEGEGRSSGVSNREATKTETRRLRSNPFVKRTAGLMREPIETREPIQSRQSSAAINPNPFVSRLPKPGPMLIGAKPQERQDDKGDKNGKPQATVVGEAEAGAFLKALHTDACKTFETVLGPDANAAHKDHFHLDMKKRRYVKICE